MRVSIVVGTRPEAIKLAPLIHELKKRNVTLSVCKTGQHTDMVDSVFRVFDITADVDFSIMGQTENLNDTIALLLQKFQTYFSEFKPDLVFVQGDTVSVFAGAVAAFNLQIEVAHVEAGLRTGNIASPWPEEGFRSMVSPITRYHFAPTTQSAENLRRAGVPDKNIFVTGNTVIDALRIAQNIIEQKQKILHLPEEVLDSKNTKRILITGHRRENFGEGLDNLCKAIARLAERYGDIDFIFPVHLNPVVQEQVKTFFVEKHIKNVILIEPQHYLEFIWLMKNSFLIVTDSGGIQEEAPGLGKPVLVTRNTTERPEGVVAGTVKLVGTSEASLFDAVCGLLDNKEAYRAMAMAKNPYGDGQASQRIVEEIFHHI
ncbi:MAG: hypothetical protein RLZZ480_331 [Candidatus Parcubacteria bacterium]